MLKGTILSLLVPLELALTASQRTEVSDGMSVSDRAVRCKVDRFDRFIIAHIDVTLNALLAS